MATSLETEEDADLAALLDSALADFSSCNTDEADVAKSNQKEDERREKQEPLQHHQQQEKPKPLTADADAVSSTARATGGNNPQATLPSDPNEAAEKLASELLGGLEGLYTSVQNNPPADGDTEEFISRLESQISNLDSTMRSLIEPSAGDDADPSVSQMKEELRRLVDNIDKSNVSSPQEMQDISQTMQDTLRKLDADLPDPGRPDAGASAEASDPLAPFMEQMLSALLSRDVLYVPLKGIVDKYPSWIEENAGHLSAEKASTYRRQLGLMQEVCREFEKSSGEPDTMKVFNLVQQMQELGPPPDDLVGEGDEDVALPAALSKGGNTGCPTM